MYMLERTTIRFQMRDFMVGKKGHYANLCIAICTGNFLNRFRLFIISVVKLAMYRNLFHLSIPFYRMTWNGDNTFGQISINESWNIRDSHALHNECVTFSCHKFHKYLKKYFTPIRWFFFSRFYFHSHSNIYFFHLLFFLWFFCRATIFVCVNFPLILLK